MKYSRLLLVFAFYWFIGGAGQAYPPHRYGHFISSRQCEDVRKEFLSWWAGNKATKCWYTIHK